MSLPAFVTTYQCSSVPNARRRRCRSNNLRSGDRALSGHPLEAVGPPSPTPFLAEYSRRRRRHPSPYYQHVARIDGQRRQWTTKTRTLSTGSCIRRTSQERSCTNGNISRLCVESPTRTFSSANLRKVNHSHSHLSMVPHNGVFFKDTSVDRRLQRNSIHMFTETIIAVVHIGNHFAKTKHTSPEYHNEIASNTALIVKTKARETLRIYTLVTKTTCYTHDST